MRLLNTTTFEVQFFATERLAPKYAILSHRWEEQEVVFRDLCNEIVNDDHVYRMKENGTKKGYYKLYKACEQARSDAIDWIWVDTCCIDKSDNNELSEAINSMFRWYEKAVICYVFLCDVDAVHAESFGSSKWFRRGWTLQELLAPKKAIFYDALWQPIGTKQTLSLFIEEVTGIPGFVLTDSKWIKVQSIAKRMSWVSRRSTTRPEDIAYCLLGIFDVNMDLRYGEREKAFTRLQEEILRRNGQIDQSILAWSDSRRHYAGSLAPSPAAFRCCGRTQSWPSHEAIEVTHRGVKSSFDIAPVTLYTYIARLGCRDSDDDAHGDICLCLRHIPGTNEYIRISMHGTDRPQTKSKAYKFRLHKDITILHHNNIDKRMIGSAPGPSQSASSMIDSSFGFSVLPMSIAMGSEVDIATANTRIGAQSKGTSLIVESGFECSAMLLGSVTFASEVHGIRAILLGFDQESNPLCLVATSYAIRSLVSRDVSLPKFDLADHKSSLRACSIEQRIIWPASALCLHCLVPSWVQHSCRF